MGASRKPGPQSTSGGFGGLICPARTPGPLGINDQADPNIISWAGDTPGPAGDKDEAEPAMMYHPFNTMKDDAEKMCYASEPTFASVAQARPGRSNQEEEWQPVISGVIPVGAGMGAVTRIPVPWSGGLFVELKPRGYTPKTGSTSTLFIQNATGKRHLRLDYGYNKATGNIDYHWNQKGTHSKFGIPDHATAGSGGRALYKGAKYFRYGGRILLVVGAAVDVYSIVVAKKRLRQVARVAAGWGGAWAGCKIVGAGGAAIGSVEPGGGTAVGAVVGCVIGSIGGYAGASWVAGEAYDLIEETFFEPLPEVAKP